MSSQCYGIACSILTMLVCIGLAVFPGNFGPGASVSIPLYWQREAVLTVRYSLLNNVSVRSVESLYQETQELLLCQPLSRHILPGSGQWTNGTPAESNGC